MCERINATLDLERILSHSQSPEALANKGRRETDESSDVGHRGEDYVQPHFAPHLAKVAIRVEASPRLGPVECLECSQS